MGKNESSTFAIKKSGLSEHKTAWAESVLYWIVILQKIWFDLVFVFTTGRRQGGAAAADSKHSKVFVYISCELFL